MVSEPAKTDAEEFVAEAFRETMGGGDPEAVPEYFSEDLDYYSSSGDHGGPSELREDLEMFHTAFPDLDGEIQRMMSQEGKVSFLYTLSGTHEGAFESVPATGEPMTAKGAAIVKVDEKIEEYRLVFDNLGMLEQLGVIEE
jgi:steroid delta-isomerase-like uncharacterized protein